MKRTRILSLAWLLIQLVVSGLILLAVAGMIDLDLEISAFHITEMVFSTAGASLACWLLWQAKSSGWYLILALFTINAGTAILEFLMVREASIGELAFSFLILSAFTYQLNHSTVRTYVNLKANHWPNQTRLSLVTRIIVYSAGAGVLAELFLGWEIGIIVLIVFLSRDIYRAVRHRAHGGQA